jgi:nifR3 family TIM-barrel protein
MAVHHGYLKALAHGGPLPRNARQILRKMRIHPDERPLSIQIFGGEPETMAESARLCEALGAELVDINMGCWVPKVCRTGAGAALLRDPDLASEIVAAVVRAVRVPVTVKVRAGWDYSLFAAPELARRFQDVGARAITLHARFAKQGFEGEADWSLIEQMRRMLTVPLIGNGDVKTGADAVRMLDWTGCDGVMVGRAAISNPWRLREIRCALTGEPAPPEPTLEARIETALLHLRYAIAHEADREHFDDVEDADAEARACRALRGQIPLYIKGAPGAAQLRDRLTQCTRYAEYRDTLVGFLDRAAATASLN